MNEFDRKLYLKYRNIENKTQLLCYIDSNVLPDCARRV